MRKSIPFLLLACILLSLVACTAIAVPKEAEIPLRTTAYVIEAELRPETHTLNVSTTIHYTLPQDLAAVKLRLYANAYQAPIVSADKMSDTYPNGFSAGSCEVLSVTGSEEYPSYEVGVEDPTLLTVRLASKHARGDEITLTLRLQVTLANVRHRLGYDSDSYTLSGFYPVMCPFEDGKYRVDPYYTYGDPFLHEVSDFDVTLTLPTKVEAAASVLPSEVRTERFDTIRHYRAESMREFACVVSPRLLCKETKADDVTVRYYYEKDSRSADTLAYIQEALHTFEEAFGKHPYSSFSVVQAPFCEAGMEFSGLAIVNKDLSSSERKRTILHETAHEWWHGKVGSDEVRYPWQDEALAEYSVLYFYKCHNAESSYKQLVDDATEEYAIFAAIKGDAEVQHPLSIGEEGYAECTYRKGLLMMSSLAETVGFERVNQMLKSYAEKYAGKIAPPEGFLEIMKEVTDEAGADHFTQWLYTPLPIE